MNTSDAFTIRPGRKDDVPVLIRLVKKLAEYERLSHAVRATANQFQKHGFGESPVFHTLIAEKDEEAVGFALYFFTFSTFEGKPTLYLEDLFVLPEYRGTGIGKAFLKNLAEIARQQECGRMEWAVLDWNQSAIDFYLSIGAKPMDDWTIYRMSEDAIEQFLNKA